jgi:hypothetical protein
MEEQKVWELDAEFTELFPKVTLEAIPEEVFARAESENLPLTAAYALYECKIHIEKLKVEEFNKKNAVKSPGKIKHDGATEAIFTLDEIKRMSPAEVAKHYDQIMKSLDIKNTNR